MPVTCQPPGPRGRVKLLLNPFTRRHDIEIEVTGDAPTVMTSAGKLHQCLVNLIQTRQYMDTGSGGLVSIDIEDRGRTAVILVRDSGRGMPPDVQARALEPFFTTKRGRGGTGLGLHLAATHLAELGASSLCTVLKTKAPPSRSFCLRHPQ